MVAPFSAPSHVSLDLECRDGLDAREVERRLRESLRTGDLAQRVTAFYLADVADRGLYHTRGFASLRQYARQRLGMAAATAREHVCVGRRLRELPDLDARLAADALNWSVVRMLASVVVPETQVAWGEWAEGKTVKEVRRMVNRRQRGDLPTDPDRRRIHTHTVAVGGRLNPVQLAVWNTAREALESERFGGVVSDVDLLMWTAHKVLREVLAEPPTRRPASAELDPRNSGPLCPEPERPPPTPTALREQVLVRDGRRCVCCGSKHNLTVHHVRWRSYGGETAPTNLVSLCEGCHSLVHDRFLILRGPVDALTFCDADGRELGERDPVLPVAPPSPETGDRLSPPGESRAEGAARAARAAAQRVEFEDLPTRVDGAWWRRHRHLFRADERAGGLVFEPGHAACAQPSRRPRDAVGGSGRLGLRLDDLIGQERVRAHLEVAIRGARRRSESLGHVLLSGPPGLGKTSLAHALATELEAPCRTVLAPAVLDPALLVRHLTSLEPGSVLFLDEAHRLPPRAAEVLYGALSEGALELSISCGWEQKTLRLELFPFTLVAATTDEDRLPPPLRGRFIHRQRLDFYTRGELACLLERAAGDMGLTLTRDAGALLAGASRDTPREALALLQLVRDEVDAGSAKGEQLDVWTARSALTRAGVSTRGINAAEREYLSVLARAPGPLGLSSLAARLGEARRTVQEVYEPFLLRRGLVRLTPRGRCLGPPAQGERAA